MLRLLGQAVLETATQAATQVAASQAAAKAFDYSVWLPKGYYGISRSIGVLAGITLLGLMSLYLFRRMVERFRLKRPLVVGGITLAFYAALFAYRWRQWGADNDPIVWWINRVAGAFFLYVGLRLLDRLAVVPALTRGGKLPLTKFVHQMVNIVVGLFALVIFGSVAFGWDIDKFLAGSAVVSIVLGLALQETLGNFFSGLVMQASPPFSAGDFITIDAFEGRVVDMTWRAVTLQTTDDNFVVIPNGTIAKANITNFHSPSTATARTITIGLDTDIEPTAALDALKVAALETQGVMATPEPRPRLLEFTSSGVTYQLKFWIDEPAKHRDIEHMVRVHVWYRMAERGIPIPIPSMAVEHVSMEKKRAKTQMAAIERRARVFDDVPLLQPLSGEQKRRLAASANDVALAPEQVLFRQEDAGDSFYVISKGTVDVLVRPAGGGAERKVATLGVGDFFGEMSALTGQPRTATIRAATAFWGIQIEKADLMEIFSSDPSIMEKMSAVVARRNAEREALAAGPASRISEEVAVTQQRSILARMKRFFRMGVGVN